MKIVFVSNFLNHHQLPFCLAMKNTEGIDFWFVANQRTPNFRVAFGYEDMNAKYDFVIRTYEGVAENTLAKFLCEEADVVIIGSASDSYIKNRLKNNKLTFRFSERIYKKKPHIYEIPLRAIKYFIKSGRYRNLYLLCASAFAASDYAKTGTFINKAYKWGYFPEVKFHEDIENLIARKRNKSILWAGRFIDWKHPQIPIEIAKRLKAEGYDFNLAYIGNGELLDATKQLAEKENVFDCVEFLGSMSPKEVREHMENSEIFLFTSDRNEGWGAVLNESMNSGCAVVANENIGSAPFLINNEENGFMYKDGNIDDLYKKVKYLLDNPQKRIDISKKAYETMVNEWNAENAANKLIKLSERIINGEKSPDLFEKGVCSKA